MIEREQLQQGIAALEAQRVTLGDAVVDTMIAAAREKLLALDASRIPSQPVAERVRAPLADLQGQRKIVTVIIVDVKGSTELLEHLGTEAWVSLMNRIFHVLETEIYGFGGEIDQFRGDGLVAFFGATAAHEDDPERAVLASLAMQAAMQPLADEVRQRDDLELLLRIGVNTGEVIVGSVGRNQHREDTAMGEGITVAARMEQAAKPGTILVSENTYRLTQSPFRWRALGTMTVKGVSRPIAVYRPLSSRAAISKVRGIAGLGTPLVGRQNEMQALRTAIERLQAGKGGIVTVVGEAGLGKSRLIAELYADGTACAPSAVRWVEGRCPSYGTSIAYLLWIDILHGLLDITADAPPEDIRYALSEHVQALSKVKCRYPERRKTIYPFVGQLLSLPLGSEATAQLHDQEGEALKRGTFRAVESLIEGTAQQQPLVIVCEDLHWADPTSLELLSRLLAMTDRVPLLFICALRPGTAYGGQLIKRITAQRHGRQQTDLWLVPLSNGESETLLHHLLRIDGLPPQFKARILNHAEGNPFYLEELIRSLIDAGVIIWDRDAGRCETACETATIAIPDTLYGVLMARIDRLPDAAKRILQLASVVGRTFTQRLLSAVDHEQHPLNRILPVLQREELIVEQTSAPEMEYAFKHHMIQDVAYNTLLQQERPILHQRVAEALERLHPDRRDEQVGVFAHHWERAARPKRALRYLLRAGQQAALQFANVEAEDYFSRALPLTSGQNQERYIVLAARERIYDLMGAREKQVEDLAALTALVGDLRDAQRDAEVSLRRAKYAEATGDYNAAVKAAQHVIRLAKPARDRASEAAGYLAWGRALYFLGDDAGAYKRLQQALDRANAFPQVQADALRSLGMAAADPNEAQEYYQQALHIHRKIGDQRGEWAAIFNLSVLAMEREQCAQAVAYGEDALHICRRIGDRQGERQALDNLGYIAQCRGDYARARTYFEKALAICAKIEDRRCESQAAVQLCALLHLLGDDEHAETYGHQALAAAQAVDDTLAQSDAQTYLGHIWRTLGKLHDAEDAYRQALNLLAETDVPGLTLDPQAGLAQVALDRGNTTHARSLVTKIQHDLDTSDIDYSEADLRVYLTCWRVLTASRDMRARSVLAPAHEALRRRAAKVRDPEHRRAFLEDARVHREIVAVFGK